MPDSAPLPASSPDGLFSPLVEQAIELSAQWHDGTYRKSRWRDAAFALPEEEVLRVPVIAHVTAVGLTVQRARWDDVTIAAAFLHDAVEDDNRFRQRLKYEELARLIGQDVADRVMEVTEQKFDAEGQFRSWRDRKTEYVAQLRTASQGAVAISLADKLHNLWTMSESLARGIDIFTTTPTRRGLSAGPERQRWFHHAVLDASTAHPDPRLVPMRERLRGELERFEGLVGG